MSAIGQLLRKPLAFVSGEYGMAAVLLLLAVFFSVLTIEEKSPEGASAGRKLAKEIINGLDKGPINFPKEGQINFPKNPRIFIASGDNQTGRDFAKALEDALLKKQLTVVGKGIGGPPLILREMEKAGKIDLIATAASMKKLPVFDTYLEQHSDSLIGLIHPESYRWPIFLTVDNFRNITSQIAVIAILAIGMTMVIITAGIDLSVGSMIALSAVVTCKIIEIMGGEAGAGAPTLVIASVAGIAVCSLAGAFTGLVVSRLCVPPFIATLAMMQVLRGGAFKIAKNDTIFEKVPASFQWLGNGLSFGIPNCVILMLILYIAAHIIMNKTILGRYIYATGANPEAARMSGISPRNIKLIVYAICGATAGLGGVVMASQLQSGAGTYGETYELMVIAAVVVGGTSLFGGKGRIFGTLIGAFIIAVISNGMNILLLGSETQMIVLGLVILTAVILERIRSGEWRNPIGG